MSKNTKNKKLDVNVERLRDLKKLGFLKQIKSPTKNHPLSQTHKTTIRNLYAKLSTPLNAPDSFTVLSTTKLNKNDTQLLKDTGYLQHGNKVFIPKEGMDKVSLTKKFSKGEAGHEKSLVITRSNKNGRKKLEEYIGTNIQKLEWRDRLEHEFKNIQGKNGEYYGLKLYNNKPFTRIFGGIAEAFKYLEIDFDLKGGDETDKLMKNIHLVKITVADIKELKTENMKEKRKRIRRASKNKKRLGYGNFYVPE